MKNIFTALATLSCAGVLVTNGSAQGTAFTYQGRLNHDSASANHVYDLRFKLFDAATNGDWVGRLLELDDVPVTDGLFSVLLDFGNEDGEVFNGQPRWLEIAVRPGASSGGFATLTPRQLLAPTPYAIAAGTIVGPVPDTRLSSNVVFLNTSPTFAGTVTAGGNLVGAQLNVGSGHELSASFSSIAGGQSNTIASGFFSAIGGGFGNTIRYNDYYSTIGGGYQNSILFGASESTIGGGSLNSIEPNAYRSIIGGGSGNRIQDTAFSSTIAGGYFNLIGPVAIYSTIGGGNGNRILTNAQYSTIGGGGANLIEANTHFSPLQGSLFSTIGGGFLNRIQDGAYAAGVVGGYSNQVGISAAFASLGGGEQNSVGEEANHATISGGRGNIVESNADWSVVAGGQMNTIHSDSTGAAIVGGSANVIGAGAAYSVVGGGMANSVRLNADGSAIGGGRGNVIGTNAQFAAIPGGRNNTVGGLYGFAAGRRARASHDGAFVWADATDADMASTETNQFTVRASGGVRLLSNPDATTGVELAPGSGAWSTLSDRHSKTNLVAIEPREILDRLAAIPIQAWNYKSQDPAVRHLGPTAQDFHAAFGLGESDRTISTLDADGVALAAIQGLNQKLEQVVTRKDAEIGALKATVEELRAALQALARRSQAEHSTSIQRMIR